MKYLNGPEQETLKVLSVPRFWNRDIFNSLIEIFKTGYSLTAFSELKRFSFVQETEGKMLLHPLMRPLRNRGWVEERSEKKNKGKGRPVKYYQLTLPFSQIVKILEDEFLKDNKEKMIALKRLRELETTLQN